MLNTLVLSNENQLLALLRKAFTFLDGCHLTVPTGKPVGFTPPFYNGSALQKKERKKERQNLIIPKGLIRQHK